MKAKELMIDDWVLIDRPDKYAGAKAQIKSLIFHKEDDGQYFSVFIHDELGIVRREVFNEDLRPIPLTAEILEKNDFVCDMFYGEWQFDLDTFPFNFPFSVVQRKNNSWYLGREEIGIVHNREIINISYVHELQHALRLCGINKEIEL